MSEKQSSGSLQIVPLATDVECHVRLAFVDEDEMVRFEGEFHRDYLVQFAREILQRYGQIEL